MSAFPFFCYLARVINSNEGTRPSNNLDAVPLETATVSDWLHLRTRLVSSPHMAVVKDIDTKIKYAMKEIKAAEFSSEQSESLKIEVHKHP